MNEGVVISMSLVVHCENCGKERNGLVINDLWMLNKREGNGKNVFFYLCPDCWQEKYKDETEEQYLHRIMG